MLGNDREWPSPESLLSERFSRKLAERFGALGTAAMDIGFRGVCVDVEYPYPRYSLEHEVYDYDGYTADDLLGAARNQGRLSAGAVLDGFPDAPIITLPGSIRCRPICRHYLLGMLEEICSRDSKGGLHMGTEFSYALHDPVTTAAIPRFPDLHFTTLLSEETLAYWKEFCTTAPGVWPLHMVQKGGEDYPVRPWKEEIVELREQMAILRPLSKRYIWSFSGTPLWYVPSEEIEKRYDLPPQKPPRQPDIDIRNWHSVLKEKDRPPSSMEQLIESVSIVP